MATAWTCLYPQHRPVGHLDTNLATIAEEMLFFKPREKPLSSHSLAVQRFGLNLAFLLNLLVLQTRPLSTSFRNILR